MVTLRVINVYPQALASLLAPMPGFTGEFICVLASVEGREALTVRIECDQPADAALTRQYHQHLRHKLGVEVAVELVQPQSLATLTGVESRQKPIRLIDER